MVGILVRCVTTLVIMVGILVGRSGLVGRLGGQKELKEEDSWVSKPFGRRYTFFPFLRSAH